MRQMRARTLLGLWSLACGACAAPATPTPGTAAEPTGADGSETPAPAPAASSGPRAADEHASTPSIDYAALVAAADRDEADRELDAGRKPVQTLSFFGVMPGMRVAEIAAAAGYTAELLARAVGPTGKVYGVNSRFVLDRFAEGPWSERLTKPVMSPVERLDREFDDPFPADLRELDLVVNVLFYHDTVWMKSDRAAMNAAVLRALRPGGHYVIIDHSAADGHGVADAQTLHRIEPSVVKAEVEATGFELVAVGTFLQDPHDTRDWNAAPRAAGERRGTSDRFAFKFVKP